MHANKTFSGRARILEDNEHAALVDQLLLKFEERGAPQGSWLFEIERVRGALRDADELLRQLHDAIIRAHDP